MTKNGSDKLKAYISGYERGINYAKERVLEIINNKRKVV